MYFIRNNGIFKKFKPTSKKFNISASKYISYLTLIGYSIVYDIRGAKRYFFGHPYNKPFTKIIEFLTSIDNWRRYRVKYILNNIL